MASLRWESDCPRCTKHITIDLEAMPIDTTYGPRLITREATFYTCFCGERIIIPAGMVNALEPSPTAR